MTMTAGTGDTCQNKLEPNYALCGVKKFEDTYFESRLCWANIWFWIRIDFERTSKTTVFWDVLTLCGLVKVYWRFERTCDLSFWGWSVSKWSKQQAVTQDEGRMFVRNVGNLYQTTRRHIPQVGTVIISSRMFEIDSVLCGFWILWQNWVLFKWKSRGMETGK